MVTKNWVEKTPFMKKSEPDEVVVERNESKTGKIFRLVDRTKMIS